MRVICDDCQLLVTDYENGGSWCKMGYRATKKEMENKYYSNSCRLVKIITLDGEILPEEVEE